MGDPRQATDEQTKANAPADEMEGLDVFTDEEGKRYATHPFGYTVGLDDVPGGGD